MRVTCVALSVLAASCGDSTAGQLSRTVNVPTVAREKENSARDAKPLILVWARDKQGAAWTYQVLPDGAPVVRLDGIHIGTRNGEWTWVTRTVDVETEPCDLSLGAPQAAQGGSVTRGSLVAGGEREQVVVEPDGTCDEHCPNEVRHAATPIASLGRYLFVEESRYIYACGAHGSTASSFLVWDVEQGRPVDVVSGLPNEPELRAEAEKRFAEDADELGGPFGDEAAEITEIVPVLGPDHRLSFEALVTIPTCYACSDGLWGSYTRSVRVPSAPPPALAKHSKLPPAVPAFLNRHPDLTFGGWSEAPSRGGAPSPAETD